MWSRAYPLDIDLLAVEQEIQGVYDSLFSAPPAIDCHDWFDGENLSQVQGRHYKEIPFINEGDLIDIFPLLALVENEAAQYYMASYLLECVHEMNSCRKQYARTFSVCFLSPVSSYLAAYLEREEVVTWVCSIPRLRNLVVVILDLLVNSVGHDYGISELLMWNSIRRRLVPEQYPAEAPFHNTSDELVSHFTRQGEKPGIWRQEQEGATHLPASP